MVGEEVVLIQNYGPVLGIFAIVIITGRWILVKTFEQVEKANASMQENNKDSREFLQEHVKKNTEALTEIKTCLTKNSDMLTRHVESKDAVMEVMKEQNKTITDQNKIINDLYGRINQSYNRNDNHKL